MPCAPTHIVNPETRICVTRKGKVGKRLLAEEKRLQESADPQREGDSCGQDALSQMSGTCYMASATLIASRVFGSLSQNAVVSRYLQQSTEWAQNKAKADGDVCPMVPRPILTWFGKLENHNVANRLVAKGDVARESHKLIRNVDEGGSPQKFLCAILWASDIPADFGMSIVLPKSGKGLFQTFKDDALYVKHVMLRKKYWFANRFANIHVITYAFPDLQVPLNAQNLLTITEALRIDEMQTRAFILQIDGVGAHAMTAFPCRRGLQVCNSWGKPCFPIYPDGVGLQFTDITSRFKSIDAITAVYVPKVAGQSKDNNQSLLWRFARTSS